MHKIVNFRNVVDRIKSVTGLNQKQISSQIFDITNSNLSNRIRENRTDFHALVSWAVNENINLDWLITGRGKPTVESSSRNEQKNGVVELDQLRRGHGRDIPHEKILPLFKDPEKARKLNLGLVELEHNDPSEYDYIRGYVDRAVKEVHEKKGEQPAQKNKISTD